MGRTDSTKDLSDDEAFQLIERLQKQAFDDHKRGNSMRRKIIGIAHELGWEEEDGSPDLARIDAFCSKRGAYHKPLNKHKYNELPTLVTQFEQLLKTR